MEIRRLLWGDAASAAVSARPAQRAEGETAEPVKEPGDRLELTRQWTEQMKEQSARLQAALSQPAGEEEKSGGILGMLDYMETEEDKLDAMSEQLDIQMKCLKIAMNIMKGKKVPPEDERYLMEHDPNGYKLAMAMKSMVKEDKKECKSVLDDEDKNGGESSDTGEAESPSGGEAAVSSSGGEAVE